MLRSNATPCAPARPQTSLPLVALLAAVLFAPSVGAQVTPEERAPAPPSIPDAVANEQEAVTGQVEIVPPKKAKVVEYRRNGRLYMLKVTPTSGRPYYLVDSDGDGNLDAVRDGLSDPTVPQWVLHSWK
ncbi:MAG: DUF2782 domain-containing protein [Gammaproteobacteria bacterium]